ncbi:hypothetical protein ACSBR1_019110 [Camellia fascicularis]
MAITEGGHMFLKAVDCSDIEKVDPDNVIQVITDNAKNCSGARLLIEGLYSNIVWTPCVDDVRKAKFVKEKVIDGIWWDLIDYILSSTAPIYDMLRDTKIEKVRVTIYRHEGQRLEDLSTFYEMHKILVDRWNKNNTLLHCFTHSLNPRYYSDQ